MLPYFSIPKTLAKIFSTIMPYGRIAKELRPLYVKGLPTSRVWKQLARFNEIANYEGSAYQFPQVDKLELVFKNHTAYGHMGARKFWRNNLPTVNFHNPDMGIEVKRVQCETKEQQHQCPSVLKVHFKDGNVKEIDCKDRQHADIMTELVDVAKGVAVPDEQIPKFEYE